MRLSQKAEKRRGNNHAGVQVRQGKQGADHAANSIIPESRISLFAPRLRSGRTLHHGDKEITKHETGRESRSHGGQLRVAAIRSGERQQHCEIQDAAGASLRINYATRAMRLTSITAGARAYALTDPEEITF